MMMTRGEMVDDWNEAIGSETDRGRPSRTGRLRRSPRPNRVNPARPALRLAANP